MLYKKSVATGILQILSCKGKLPLPLLKYGNNPVIIIYANNEIIYWSYLMITSEDSTEY